MGWAWAVTVSAVLIHSTLISPRDTGSDRTLGCSTFLELVIALQFARVSQEMTCVDYRIGDKAKNCKGELPSWLGAGRHDFEDIPEIGRRIWRSDP